MAPTELADCVIRALKIPEIASLRPGLKAEFPVHAASTIESRENVTIGIADAIAFDSDGSPQVVVDWKSDVDPAPETIEHYRAQVRAYLDMTEAKRGLIVMMTTGAVIPVELIRQRG